MEEVFFLVKYQADYADEFDVSGFCVLSKKEYSEMMINSKKVFEETSTVELFFGTNESISYYSFDAWYSDLDITIINKEKYDFLVEIFGSTQYGTVLIPSDAFY